MNKLRKFIFIFVITFCFIINADAVTIKEDASTYDGDVYIIGSSKFDNNITITGTLTGRAGARESFIQYFINYNFEFNPDDLVIYQYSSDEDEWYILPATVKDEAINLTDEEVEELTDNLNIYYVNDVEKTHEVSFNAPSIDGYELEFYTDIPGKSEDVKYEGGKLIIPATVRYLEAFLTKGEDEVILLDSFEITEEEIVADSKVVTTLAELKAAIDNEEEIIRLGNNISGITETITIPYSVEFRGAGHKLSFDNIEKVNGVASGLVLQGSDSYVDYLEIDMNSPKGWNSHYALQVYGASEVYLDGFKAVNSDAGVLVNGSVVKLYGNIDLTGNEFGGIEVSKGSSEYLPYGELLIFTHVTMDDETALKPVIWVEKVDNPIEGATYNMVYDYSGDDETETNYIKDETIPQILGKNQDYYYINSVYDDETINVSSEEEFKVAMYLENVKKVTLVDDIDFETALIVDKQLTVLLNGHTLTIANDTVGDGVFHVVEGGDLTINGEGTINGIGKNDYNMAIWADGGKVTINGGTYTNVGATAEEDPTHMDLIYVKNGGEVVINGGRFEAETPKWTLNSHDTKIGTITVKGGTFVNYNPSNSNTEPAKANTNFVAEGYVSVKDGNKYTVVEAEGIVVTGDSLQDAVDNAEPGATLLITKDMDLPTAVQVSKKLTLELNGHTLTIANDTVGDGVFHVVEDGDLTINGEGTINGIGKNDYNMAIWADGGKVTINGGTYTNVGATAEEDPTHMDLIYVKNGGEVVINGGRFEAETPKWTLNSHDTKIGTITVKGGTFVGYNPANSNTEPEKVNTNFVAEGYTVVEDNGVYTVQAIEE